ncbi:hypothetical protein P879_11395 [Paragonimus westermani]|uniref:Serpin domain-containing protein n=1 Tax=Paragonimus westermani TaxID=34504 RepID=A0A8T0DD04_9TREM|nr:hypothetical protein P879_11395 [Paragonimus westermani]
MLPKSRDPHIRMCYGSEDRITSVELYLVDEEGATAAAATAVMVVKACAMVKQTVHVCVDRPFCVALLHAYTVPVFIGHVTHPESG